jgi:hypothetical protein
MDTLSLSKLLKKVSCATTSDLPQYEYSGLPHKAAIRLLEVEPSGKKCFTCSLVTFDLYNEAPPFDTLSYTWRNPYSQFSTQCSKFEAIDREYPIICDGKALFVRANPRHALDMLSQPPSKFGFPCQRYIWIDSICINQKDSNEKNAQVSVMADIYQMAVRAKLWIGGMDEFSDDAFSALNQLSVIPPNAHEMVRADDWWDHEKVFPSKLGIESPSLN